jgi:hypothetical protein
MMTQGLNSSNAKKKTDAEPDHLATKKKSIDSPSQLFKLSPVCS